MQLLRFAFLVIMSLSLQWGLAQTNNQTFGLTNVTIHVGNGQVIENGVLGVKNGKIAVVGNSPAQLPASEYAQIIDGKQQHVYPSVIAANTQLGLVEAEAVRATRDFYEVGNFNPNIRSIIAYNAESEIIPTIRCNGVLIAESVPQGGRISGQSSVVQFDAYNWEDALVKADNAVHLWFPARFYNSGWWAEPGKTHGNKNYTRDLQAIKLYFDEAVAYSKKTDIETKNLKFEVMKELLARRKKLFVHVDEARATVDAIELFKSYGVEIVVVGGGESFLIADILQQNNIPVIYTGTHELPYNPEWDTDQMFKTPALLQAAGVKFCIAHAGSWQQRNLPFIAGNTVGYGLSKEQALSAITLWTAQILGIDNRLGSLEVGKDATFFISKGDALDMKTSIITDAFIQGKKLDLSNKQTRLYDKYMEKLGLPK